MCTIIILQQLRYKPDYPSAEMIYHSFHQVYYPIHQIYSKVFREMIYTQLIKSFTDNSYMLLPLITYIIGGEEDEGLPTLHAHACLDPRTHTHKLIHRHTQPNPNPLFLVLVTNYKFPGREWAKSLNDMHVNAFKTSSNKRSASCSLACSTLHVISALDKIWITYNYYAQYLPQLFP